MFYKEAREFIAKVIRSRTRLIQLGESKINKAWALNRIDLLDRHLSYFKYQKNEEFAIFWERHRAAIMELMPGGNSKSAQTFMTEFHRLDREHILHLPQKREYA